MYGKLHVTSGRDNVIKKSYSSMWQYIQRWRVSCEQYKQTLTLETAVFLISWWICNTSRRRK